MSLTTCGLKGGGVPSLIVIIDLRLVIYLMWFFSPSTREASEISAILIRTLSLRSLVSLWLKERSWSI